MEYITLDKKGTLSTGKYKFTFKVLVFPETLAEVLNAFKGFLSKSLEVMDGKHIRIDKVYNVSGGNKIAIEFTLLQNPVPVAIIVGVIIGLIGLGGILMTLDKVEGIVESPAGVGIGMWLVLGAVVFGYNFYLKNKG